MWARSETGPVTGKFSSINMCSPCCSIFSTAWSSAGLGFRQGSKALAIKHLSLGSLSEYPGFSCRTATRDCGRTGWAGCHICRLFSLNSEHQKQIRAAGLQGLTAVDGTLPLMMWALWLDDNRAAKMHLQFDVLKSIPCDATLTAGNSSAP